MNELTQQVSKQVLENFYRMLSSLVGDKFIELLKRKEKQNNTSDIPKIMFEMAGEVANLLGAKGSFAIFREIGREIAYGLMKTHPKEQWDYIFNQGLQAFIKGIHRKKDSACIYSCVFYPNFLEKNLQPLQHPICWICCGFVEGFMKVFNNAKGAKFIGRDTQKELCCFKALYNLDRQ